MLAQHVLDLHLPLLVQHSSLTILLNIELRSIPTFIPSALLVQHSSLSPNCLYTLNLHVGPLYRTHAAIQSNNTTRHKCTCFGR